MAKKTKDPFILYARKSKDNGPPVYWVIFKDENGKRASYENTGETNRDAARTWAWHRLTEQKKTDDKAKEITLGEFTKDFFKWGVCPWIARKHKTGHSFSQPVAKNRRAHLDRFVLPVFGKTKLRDIKAYMISDFLQRLKLSHQSVNHIRTTLSIVFGEAVFREQVEYNPVKNVERMDDDHKKRDIFSDVELHKLFPVDQDKLFDIWAGPYWSTMFYKMMTTGCRLGEARALLWANVDWDIPAITISQAVKADKSIGKPKSGRERAAYLPPRTVALLAGWKGSSRYTSMNDFIFHGKDGQSPVGGVLAWTYFLRGIKKAGIDIRDRNIVLHSLRHQYNSAMRRAVSEQALQFMIGHTSEKMTQNYDQAGPLDKLRAFLPEQEKINKVWK